MNVGKFIFEIDNDKSNNLYKYYLLSFKSTDNSNVIYKMRVKETDTRMVIDVIYQFNLGKLLVGKYDLCSYSYLYRKTKINQLTREEFKEKVFTEIESLIIRTSTYLNEFNIKMKSAVFFSVMFKVK